MQRRFWIGNFLLQIRKRRFYFGLRIQYIRSLLIKKLVLCKNKPTPYTKILKAKWKEINEKIEDFYKYLDSDENFEGFVHLKKDEIFVNASKREL